MSNVFEQTLVFLPEGVFYPQVFCFGVLLFSKVLQGSSSFGGLFCLEMESCCILLAGLELCRPDYPQTILPLHSRTGTTRHSLCRLFIIANPSVSVSEENVKSMISFNLQSNTAKYRSPTVKPFPADTKSKVSDIGLLSVLSEESFQLVIPKPGLFLCSWLYSEKAVLKDTRMWMS